MKRTILYILFFLPLSLSAQTIQEQIDSLLTDPYFQTTQVSLLVYDLTADSVVFSHQPYQRLRPASCEKVVTAVIALSMLGGDHPCRTRLYADGTQKGRTFVGDLYCVGGFDPMFGYNELQQLVSAVRQQNIDTIRGRICADLSMKSAKKWGEGWCWDDKNPTLSPLLYNQQPGMEKVFLAELKRAGVVVVAGKQGGGVTERRCPSSARMIGEVSHPLSEVLIEMLKESNNLFAESVFFQLAASTGQRPATDNHARNQMKTVLSLLNIDEGSYNIADGSGLSLYNYTTASNLVTLLRFAYKNPQQIYQPFLAALPIAGVDGTLKKRMVNGPARNRVQAKTGTLTGVSALAGYATSAENHRLCFAIINQGIASHSPARDFQDKVCEILCR